MNGPSAAISLEYGTTQGGWDDEHNFPRPAPELTDAIRNLSTSNATHIREISRHFQTLISAGENKVLLTAPGLFFPRFGLYVISKSGHMRGHASLYNSLRPLLPEPDTVCYAFVLYPVCFLRTCFDRVLRKTAKSISPDLRLSMENVFNRKYHEGTLTDSEIERQLLRLFKSELR